MNSKERVYAALRKQPVDRVPIFMWFHPVTARRLADLLEIPPQYVPAAMGDDVRQTWVNNNYAMEGITHDLEGESHLDIWRIKWTKIDAFNQIAEYPLLNATRDELLQYEFPYDHLDELMALMTPVARQADQYFIGCDVSPCVFEMYWRLRGMENVLMEIAADPDLADKMFQKCSDFSVKLSQEACSRFKLDWLWTGDDVCSQQALLMSPRSWRDTIKPHLQRIVEVGKSHNLYNAYHCCGAVEPIIADLIEIGIDVLNPIQFTTPAMEPAHLKKEYGSKISFMGGVDTQGVLPHGTPLEVQRATAQLIQTMTSDGGGFILAASHTVPPETSDDNIFAMYATAGLTKQEIFDRAADIRKSIPDF